MSRASVCVLAVALAVSALAAEKLPRDERIQSGELSNGVKWMYRQHDNPPGKMALMIHVDSGSLNETEEQRGLAHFLEHMAFNGTEHFGPGELLPYFESIGMEFGADLNAFTSFDQTVYMLYLPDTKTEMVGDGLKVLSDYAFRMSLLAEELEKERGVILSELRAGMSSQQRLRDKLFEQLFVDTRLGKRLPIGLEKVIRDTPRDGFEDYYRTWYRPENVTLMMVGDAPLEQYQAVIEEWFGEYKAPRAARKQEGCEFKPFTAERAIVLSDPEYGTGDVDVYNILPGRPPTTTVEQAHVELVEQIGSWMIGRRFAERIKKGESSYRQASAVVQNFFPDEGVLVNASAVGEPKDWERMLEEVIVEVNQAREHGFLEQELALAKKEILADAEHAVRTEPTRNANAMIGSMRRAVNDREPIMAAAQELELIKQQLPTIALAEVDASFAANFKSGAFAYVLTMPEKEGVELPSEADVLAAAKAAQARKTTPMVWEERPTEILEHAPTPGEVVESAIDEDLGITSAWLENGVRVHHRLMDYKKDSVLVSITLAGGEIQETAENTGATTIASLPFSQQLATKRLKSTDIEDIMTGKNIRVRGGGQGDTFGVTITGSPQDLEIGLQLAHALLTDARIEQSAFDNWKQASLQQWEMVSRMPQFRAIEALLDLTSGGDPRRTMMTPAKIEAQSIERSQAWLEELCRTAPIEVAVVGEIKLEEAMPLIEKYVGSLGKRPRSAAHLDKLRKLARQPGPLVRRVSVNTITPQAMMICGFMGSESVDVADTRALNLAARILDSRLIKRVREELGLVYSIGAQSRASSIYDDSGLFLTGAPCEPGKGDVVIQEVQTIFQAFADSGPTAEELANAKKQVHNDLDTELKEPSFWFEQLQSLDLHKIKLADLKNIDEAYQALTAEELQKVFAKYYRPERIFDIVANPEASDAESGAEEEAAEEAEPSVP